MVLYLGDFKEVYELKPITYKPGNPANPIGKAQLQSYIDGFNSQTPGSALAGTLWDPNGWVIADPYDPNKEIVLYTYQIDPGMIYYGEPRKKRTVQEEVVPETETAPDKVTFPEGIMLDPKLGKLPGLPRIPRIPIPLIP